MMSTTRGPRRCLSLILILLLLAGPLPVGAQARAPAAAAPPAGEVDQRWPRQVAGEGYTMMVYQPQVEKWDGTSLEARAAVSVEHQASPRQDFGVIWLSGRTHVDKANRLVAVDNVQITKTSFPGAPEKTDDYLAVMRNNLPRAARTISLDRLQAALAITEAESAPQKSQPVKNEPPRIIFSTSPALLVLVDGKPVLRPVAGSKLLRVINTWALILFDDSTGRYYLRVLGRWAEATAVEGPWAIAAAPPASLGAVRQSLAKSEQVNMLDDPAPGLKEAAAQGRFPTIYVSTVPAELVQTEGRPSYEPIDGTQLLQVKNSSANILLDPRMGDYYVLISGRWFRAKSLEKGPWEYVAHDKLPADFAKIPPNHPRGVVLGSVAGTPQAQEAVIDNSIPQTAQVNRQTTTLKTTYDGPPQLKPVEGTPLQNVVNSPVPVIQVDPQTYYVLSNGVWFVGPSVNGPWTVATSVPPVVYTIPVSSPLHYVTYVYVYGFTPTTVTVGYTPGYYGTVVAPSSVVVYGTGYVYPAYVGAVYYPPPPTYGYGTGFAWGALTGFALGVTAAAVWGGAWGCCHTGYGYGGVYNTGTININSNNSYNKWNQNQVKSNVQSRYQSLSPEQQQQVKQQAQRRYNQQTGELTPEQRSQAQQAAQQRQSEGQGMTPQQRQQAQQAAQQRQGGGGEARQNDVFAGSDGNAYRRGSEGWERHEGQEWGRADSGGGRESGQNLDRQQQARSFGEGREQSFGQARSSGGFGGGGGGGSRGGGGGRGRR